MWMLLVLFYGLCKGGREIVKKKAMETSTVIEVLLFYTFVSFYLMPLFILLRFINLF